VIAFAEAQDYPVEVLVVDNASTDGTPDVVREIAAGHPFVSLLYQPIRGKGAAVRKGMMEGQGEYLLIYDADRAMPVEEITKFLPPALSGYDVAIASREAPGAVRYNEPWYRHLMGRVFNFIVRLLAVPWYRHLMGRVFNFIVRLLAVPDIQDTQCGFKCFRREVARDVFAIQKIDGWAFDVEILHIALRHGYRVIEVPIRWYYGEGSRISAVRDSWSMLLEVLRIRRNGHAGLYDK